MRQTMKVALVAISLVGCVPRYARLEGSGGSAGLDTIRTRILALIAAGDYAHAAEYLEAAEGFSQTERDRLEQMISAAQRHLIPFLDGALSHIFREKPGHFPLDTAEARELIQTTAVQESLIGTSGGGNQVYARLLETGAQIWVFVRSGTIRDAGQNAVPWSREDLLR